jgi:hypothetical protein
MLEVLDQASDSIESFGKPLRGQRQRPDVVTVRCGGVDIGLVL